MKIDPGSHVPIYLQIAEAIGSAIAAGVYRPGEAIPSQRALAVQMKVNPNTVQRAYDQLLRQGVVTARRGKGLFVADQGAASAQTRAACTAARALERAIATARAAGMSTDAIRDLFHSALDRGSDEEDRGSDEEDRGSDEEDRGSDEEDRGSDEEDRGSDEEDRGSDEEDRGSDEESGQL